MNNIFPWLYRNHAFGLTPLWALLFFRLYNDCAALSVQHTAIPFTWSLTPLLVICWTLGLSNANGVVHGRLPGCFYESLVLDTEEMSRLMANSSYHLILGKSPNRERYVDLLVETAYVGNAPDPKVTLLVSEQSWTGYRYGTKLYHAGGIK